MSRLRVFLLFAALLALATAFAACGGSDNSSGDPQQVIDDATLQGIESGNLDLSLKINAEGKEGGNVDVNLSGPFQSEGAGKIPKLDLTLGVNGSMGDENIDFEGGLVLLPDRAFINYKGEEYEVDPTNFSFVKSAIEQAQQSGGEGESADTTACQEAAGELKVGDFVDNLSDEGSADVDGTTTTHISGDLNVSGAIDSLTKLSEDPACSSQLGAAGSLPSGSQLEEAKSQISDALKSAHVDVYVGEDNIVREISAELSIEPPSGSDEGPEKADVSFDLKIGGVNEEQKIEAPSSTKPLSNLFMELGVNPLELLQEGGSGGLGGLEGLLNGLGESGGGSGSGGGAAGSVPGLPSSDPQAQQEYLKCLGKATTPTDLQHCAELVK